jgi:acyl dehydratase
VPAVVRYYEDIDVGRIDEFGEYHVTRDEIIEFAEQYDPQPFHVDPEAAQDSVFGGLIASGWHTAAMCMRMLVEGPIDDEAGLGGKGVDELRWQQPVTPGTTLHVRREILDTWPSESHPDRGYFRDRIEGFTDDGDVVISWETIVLIRRREAGE